MDFRPFILTFLSLIWTPLSARADFYLHQWSGIHQDEKRFKSDARFGFYTSRSNYDSNGSEALPANLDTYNRLQFEIDGAYGFTKELSVYARFAYGNATITPLTGTAGSIGGLSDQTVAANYRVITIKSGLSVDLQLQLDFPFYNNATTAASGNPYYLGDGSTDFSAGGFVNVPFGARSQRWSVAFGAALTSRSAPFSSAIAWSARVTNQASKGKFLVAAGLSGVYSLETDASLPTVRGTGAAGSAFLYAVNPTLAQANGEIGYHFTNDWALAAFGQTVIGGSNSPRGHYFGVFARYTVGGSKTTDANEPLLQRVSGRPRLSAFQGQTEYSMTARITRVNDRVNLIKIDQGAGSDVNVGQTFDVFSVNASGEIQELIARGRVIQVTDGEAAIEIQKYYKEVWIEEGFVVKRLMQ